MKKTITMLVLTVAMLSLVSCDKNKPKDLFSSLIGEWELTDYSSTKSIAIGEEDVAVYLVFISTEYADSFIIRQSIGGGYVRTFLGTWVLSGTTLTGKYEDGTEWGNTYDISITDDNTLVMKTVAKGDETCTYRRTQ